jgi:drug/metabolite transporter (DMT)-like permease
MELSERDLAGRGIIYAVIGIAFMSGLDTLAKFLGEGYGIVQLVFFRNFFGLLFLLVVLRRAGGFAGLRTRQPLLHGLRAFFALLATFAFFIGLQFMPLAEAFTLAFVGPVFVTALSVPILGEKVGMRRWSAVIVGFIGVVMMLRPGMGTFRVEALLPLSAAFGYALVMLISRRLSREDSAMGILFWTAVIGTIVTGVALPYDWTLPSPRDWGLFVLLGATGSLTMYFMTLAYRHAPAAVVAPFDYTILLWGLLFGWLIWHELPDPWIWPGATVLIVCGLYITHRETRRPAAPHSAGDSAPRADK